MDQLVHIGVAGVVADFFAFQARPGGRADDLARLRLHIAGSECFVLSGSARWVWSRPVTLDKAAQAFTATWPLVSAPG